MAEKILIVDDDIDTLRLVGLMLERQGYQVVSANNGQQAIEKARSEQPELILLDIMMPGIDGYEVTRQLRETDRTSLIPIIMFTAKTQMADKLLGFEVGADDYLTKPTQPRELLAHVKAVLARTSKTREVAQAKEHGHMIGILAPKGGLGVTTLALNLAVMLRQQTEKDVIVAEFRPGYGCLSLELGYLKPEGLNKLLKQKAAEITTHQVESELVTHRSGIRLLLSSPQPRDAKYVNEVNTFDVIADRLPHLANFIILDLGPGLPPVTEKVLRRCDEILVIVEPVPNTVNQAKALIQDLMDMGVGEGRVTAVLINRVRTDMQLSWIQVQDKIEHNVPIVITPAPELAYQASANGVPLVLQHPNSLTTEQIFALSTKISTEAAQIRHG